MVTKTNKPDSQGASRDLPPGITGTVKESAQQIWLAGLGAFAKAQEEGSKVFDALVKEGASMQHKTQSAAGEKLSEATSRMASLAGDLSSRASGQWDKLETLFESRVSKALSSLGVPTANDLEALSARIDELNRNLAMDRAKAPASSDTAGKRVRKPVAKRKPARKTS